MYPHLRIQAWAFRHVPISLNTRLISSCGCSLLSIAELPVFPGNVGLHYAKHQLDRVHIRTVGGHKEHFDAVRPTNSCQKVVGGMVDPGIVEEQHAIGHGEGMHDWNEVAPQEVHQRLEVPVAPEDLHRTEAV